MDSKKLEKLLSGYNILQSRRTSRTSKSEKQSLPSMLTIFRELIVDDIPPTQQRFIDEFHEKFPYTKNKRLTPRLKRAYLSFIREYHLGFLLREHFNEVIYDEDLDIIAGIDYIIVEGGTRFNIHAFVDTENGRYWRQKKEARHQFIGEHINLPLNLDKGKRVGPFVLYSKKDMVWLKEEIQKIIATFGG